jgi:hypothetical protein
LLKRSGPVEGFGRSCTKPKGDHMTRLQKTLAIVALGGLLLTSAACEDKETQQALQTCRNDLSGLRTSLANQNATIKDLRAQLASAPLKAEELAKAGDMAKGGRGDKAMVGKTKSAEPRKSVPAEMEKKAEKN